jgi:hypothetical protein
MCFSTVWFTMFETLVLMFGAVISLTVCSYMLTVSVLETCALTLILLMWTFGRAPNNASKFEMGFNSVA